MTKGHVKHWSGLAPRESVSMALCHSTEVLSIPLSQFAVFLSIVCGLVIAAGVIAFIRSDDVSGRKGRGEGGSGGRRQ